MIFYIIEIVGAEPAQFRVQYFATISILMDVGDYVGPYADWGQHGGVEGTTEDGIASDEESFSAITLF
ncbi:MAG: hypothetical protein IPH42_07245 [Bacteroidetes bacterium]|nr:hypothetical protein [Bacteroidota bacterium]